MPAEGRIFLSYRRGDTMHVAGRLGDRLSEHFAHVFMDIDTIEPGLDFTEAIRSAIARSDVLLALIGVGWLTAEDEQGRPRLHDPRDWVVEEIAAGLRGGLRVIPVLVDGARMPRESELPLALASLASRQAITLRYDSFGSDTRRLIAALEAALAHDTATVPAAESLSAAPATTDGLLMPDQLAQLRRIADPATPLDEVFSETEVRMLNQIANPAQRARQAAQMRAAKAETLTEVLENLARMRRDMMTAVEQAGTDDG